MSNRILFVCTILIIPPIIRTLYRKKRNKTKTYIQIAPHMVNAMKKNI